MEKGGLAIKMFYSSFFAFSNDEIFEKRMVKEKRKNFGYIMGKCVEVFRRPFNEQTNIKTHILNPLDLFGDNHRIILTNFFSLHCFVIKGTTMRCIITMLTAV